MRGLFAVLVIPVLAVVQVTLPDRLEIMGLKPDLLLIGVVFFALKTGAVRGFITGMFSGLIFDCFSLSPLGLHLFLFGLVGLVVGRAADRLCYESVPAQMFVIFAASLSVSVVYLISTRFGSRPLPFFFAFGRIGFPSAVYTTVFAPPLFFFLFRIARILKF
jgi:rod shape-determining protein MreD